MPHAVTGAEQTRTGSIPGRIPTPQAMPPKTSQLIALKDGDPIPEGYAYVVESRGVPAANDINQQLAAGDTVDLSTPPRATDARGGEAADTAKSRSAAKKNLTKNTNRKANAKFAKDLKDSLATGQPMQITVAEPTTDLKSAWHAAAKEVAYKFLDLTKESWKEYNHFEKDRVHREVNEQYKFDPPIDPKRIDKFLSCHLRTSRAVWKAHWKKYGTSNRHPNCPELAWQKLTRWWPTAVCIAEAAEMASRRAKVEKTSKVGRSSLMERMDDEVSNIETAICIALISNYFISLLRYYARNASQQKCTCACMYTRVACLEGREWGRMCRVFFALTHETWACGWIANSGTTWQGCMPCMLLLNICAEENR